MAYSLPGRVPPETLGAIELTSIARGVAVADAMVKRAAVEILDARAYCPGKFLIVVSGDVSSVEEAVTAGVDRAGASLFGKILIPNLAPGIISAINRETPVEEFETVGVVEAFSAVSIIDGADGAVKTTDITVQSINLLEGLGGKAYMILAGELTEVQAAVDAAVERIPPDMFVESAIVPAIATDVPPFFPGGSA